MYTWENLAISGQHTHSNVAGYFQYVTFLFMSFGSIDQSMQVFAEGIVESIQQATENLQDGEIFMTEGELVEAGVNRSPYAYEQNPAEERARYEWNHDKEMTLLRMEGADGENVGMLNWYAVHTTSMNNTNRLISGDNKGVASMLAEKHYNGQRIAPLDRKMVSAFAGTNTGDVSPNIALADDYRDQVPICRQGPTEGQPCDFQSSGCPTGTFMEPEGLSTEFCWATGPGNDIFESTYIIGERQFTKAKELMEETMARPEDTKLPGNSEVDSRFKWVQINDTFIDDLGVSTCPPALGYSFASGTTDGPGVGLFNQNTQEGVALLDRVINLLLGEPTPAERECHGAKPILLPTSHIACPLNLLNPENPAIDCQIPTAWHPTVVPIHVFRLGNFFMLKVPGEITTMAGRRLRESVQQTLASEGIPDAKVVITSNTDTYTHYITTPEEYSVQRYEGASNIYGPNTLAAYTQEFNKLARAMARGEPVDTLGTPAVDDRENLNEITRAPGVDTFLVNVGYFGDVIQNTASTYSRGSTASATFVSAHPRHNLRRKDTYLAVERLLSRDLPGSCPVCSCSAPTVWPFSGCNVACGASCGGTCCCIEGMGDCKAPAATWETVHTDADWETKFIWTPEDTVECTTLKNCASRATVEWDIPMDAAAGTYRLRHFATRLARGDIIGIGGYEDFTATSTEFVV
jgi:neutral ceramidase